MRPVVVKIGGSLAHEPERLRRALAGLPQSGVVVVPGGGAFADAVRAAQLALGFDDGAAHRMALLAMNQFGLALANLGGLTPACSLDVIRQSLAQGGRPVWLPWPMLCDDPDIEESWDVTSDSLAAWLAAKLGAARLVIVKAAIGRDAVDAAFDRYSGPFQGRIALATPEKLLRAFECQTAPSS